MSNTRDIADKWLDEAFKFDWKHPYTGGDDLAPDDDADKEPDEDEERSWTWWEPRYSDDQPRDDHGRFSSGAGWNSDNPTDLLTQIGYPSVLPADKTWAKTVAEVQPHETKAIFDYQKESIPLNAGLRSSQVLEGELKDHQETLDNAIEAQKASAEETILYRGIAGPQPGIAGTTAPDYAQLGQGTYVADPAFVSATTDADLAKTWAAERGGQEVLEVHVPPGVKGLDVNVHTESFSEQRETILPRGGALEKIGRAHV